MGTCHWALQWWFYDVAEHYGLPEVIKFECGKGFKGSKALGYGEQVKLWDEARTTFADKLGLKLSHTRPRNPRGKIAEAIIRLIQRKLPGEAMFVGRHEQVTAREAVRKAIQAVNAGRQTPAAVGMPMLDAWRLRLWEIIELYNNDKQDGAGTYEGKELSPAEAWPHFRPKDAEGKPLKMRRLPQELRLQVCLPRWSTVGNNGIRILQPGTRLAWGYDSPQLRPWNGPRVQVRQDPVNPTEILVTDAKNEVALLVPMLVPLDADSPTREAMQKAMRSQHDRNEYGRRIYQQVCQKFHPGFCDTVLDAEAANRLVSITEQRQAQQAGRQVETTRRAAADADEDEDMAEIARFLMKDMTT